MAIELTLRGEKGSKLTTEELDNNFLYVLENASGGGGATGSQGPQGPQGPAGSGGGVNEVGIGYEENVYSFFKKLDTISTLAEYGVTYSMWQLGASVALVTTGMQGPVSNYVKYIGKIIAPAEAGADPVSIAIASNTFVSSDSTFDKVVTPFAPRGYVTNSDTGLVKEITFASVMVDNSTFDNEYEIYVLAYDNSNFESIVQIDMQFEAAEGVELTFDRG